MTELSELLTSFLTAIKNMPLSTSGKNLIWSIKNPVEVLDQI